MAALDFPTATAAGQTFEADTGVIYVYVGTPPNGFWSANAGVSGQAALDARYVQVAGDTMTGNLINNARILIGTTTEGAANADDLTVSSSGDTGITVRSGDSNYGSILFSDATSGSGENVGSIQYEHASNFMTFGVNGSERIRIDSSGNLLVGLISAVGISGTPADLNSTEIGRGYINISRDDTSAADHIRFGKNGSVASSIGTSTTNSLTFKTGTTEQMRIDSSGRLLVGTTSTSGVAKLVVKGNTSSNTGVVDVATNLSAGGSIAAGTEIGILRFTDASANRFAHILCEGGASSGSGDYPGRLMFATTADGASSPTERMRIDSSGRVGINNTSPAELLHIIGNPHAIIQAQASTATAVSSLYFADPNSAYSGYLQYAHTTDHLEIGTASSEKVRIDSSGRVGIGETTMGVKLEVKDSQNTKAYFKHSTGNQTSLYIDSNDTYAGIGSTYHLNGGSFKPLAFLTSGYERLRISTTGLVGIGTTAPSQILELKKGEPRLCINATNAAADLGIEFEHNGTRMGHIFHNHTTGEFSISCGENTSGSHYMTFKTGNGSEAVRIYTDKGVSLKNYIEFRNQADTTWAGYLGHAQSLISGASGNDLALRSEQNLLFASGGNSEKMRLSSAYGNLAIGTTHTDGLSSHKNIFLGALANIWTEAASGQHNALHLSLGAYLSSGNAWIRRIASTAVSNYYQYQGQHYWRTAAGSTSGSAISWTTNMRLDTLDRLSVGASILTHPGSYNYVGVTMSGQAGWIVSNADGTNCLYANRMTSDGSIVQFAQNGTAEGSITVSGSTISYNGGHLTRWSQLPGNAIRVAIYRGTVLSNIDEMCEWGDENNEQLNRMKISDVEGDRNVSGVFQCWDEDDEEYTDDFYCAMTGDFVIRIGKDVTVERGDLLMSAGDGTAKPQEDDIIRSKTIAKVTSTHVSETYNDGSYCVPCVLMAC